MAYCFQIITSSPTEKKLIFLTGAPSVLAPGSRWWTGQVSSAPSCVPLETSAALLHDLHRSLFQTLLSFTYLLEPPACPYNQS